MNGLALGATYVVSASALIGGALVPASNTLPLRMPQLGAPTLVSTQAMTSRSAVAVAAPPKGVTFTRVSKSVETHAQVGWHSLAASPLPAGFCCCHGCCFDFVHAQAGSTPLPLPNPVRHASCCPQYRFTARPLSVSASATSVVFNPLNGRFIGLLPATQYAVRPAGHGACRLPRQGRGRHQLHSGSHATLHRAVPCLRLPQVSVVGLQNGVASPASNSLSFTTPAENAPHNTGTTKQPGTAEVTLIAPTTPPASGTWAAFDVTLCPVGGPVWRCITQRCTALKCTFTGLAPLTT